MEEQSKAVQVFNFQGNDLRVEMIDGEPWFVGIDVCQGLGIANHRDAIANLPQKWKSVVGVTDPHGRIQPTLCLKEPALYKLAFRSNKPEAEAFTDWIAEEVLPSIRKTGSYGTPVKASLELPPALFENGQEAFASPPLCPCPTREELETAILSMVELFQQADTYGCSLNILLQRNEKVHAYIKTHGRKNIEHGLDKIEEVMASLVKRRLLVANERDSHYYRTTAISGQIEAPKEESEN